MVAPAALRSPVRGLERRRRLTTVIHMRSLARAEGGFTLIELVVTMAILLTVLTAITGALISTTNTEADQNNRVQTQEQARQALTKLTREIHCASTLQGATTLVGGSVTAPGPLGATPANSLI